MKRILIRGALGILPLIISIWLFWSIAVTLDNLGQSVLALLGFDDPWPVTGFLLILLAVFLVGTALSISPLLWLFHVLERQIMRFPLLRTVYGAVRDMASLINQTESKGGRRQTVLARQANGGYVVGFITSDTLPEPLQQALPDEDPGDEWVPVLFQISYQMAGVTTLVRRSDLIEVDWSFDEALTYMVTAGIQRSTDR